MELIRIERSGNYQDFCRAVGEKVIEGHELVKYYKRDKTDTTTNGVPHLLNARYTAYFKPKG
ncbi:hypothetical protein [Brochothrix thermosphacta]|uniref:hypothetical protein n=1 Tax=Brochothrix thermosphacta TaxID=2756 RepID=UPI0039AF61E7